MLSMKKHLFALLALTTWAVLGVQPARAQVAVVTVQSVDALLGDAKYILKVAGREDLAKTLEGVVAALGPGGQGLTGLDMKRPLGLYVNMPKEVGGLPTGAIFIPVTKDTEFLDLVARMGGKHEKAEKGVYKVTVPQQDQTVFVKFASNYAFASDNAANLDGKLPDPAALVPAAHKGALIAASGKLDQIPPEYKQMVISQLDQKVKEESEKRPGESDAEHQGRQVGAKAVRDALVMVVEQSKDVTLSVRIDQAKNALAVDLSLAAKPGSQLATSIQSFGSGRSMFSAWVKDSAFNFLAHLPIAGEVQTNFLKVIDQAYKEGVKNAKSQKERELAEKAFNAVLPTLKSEALDVASVLLGPLPDGKYVAIAGLKVKEGKNLEKTLLELIKEIPDKDLQRIKLAKEQIGDVTVHVVQPEDVADEKAKKAFGSIQVRLVFLENAVVITVGEHGKDAMSKALASLKGAGDSTTAPVQMEAALARLAPLADEDQEKFRDAAKKVFTGDAKHKDRVRLSLQGGDAFHLRLDLNAEIIKLIAEVAPIPGS
jgi:hypothetical protein